MQVATPFVARVREPAVPAGEKVKVSVVIAIVTEGVDIFTKVITVPIGKATELFAGIVKVRALASPTG